jgi:FkbM family methyltransferase
MVKKLDLEWLKNQAKDEKSKEWIFKINEWRKFVFENNKFIKSKKLFSINLDKYKFWFQESNAFSSIEVYVEIFKENNHFLIPEFNSKDVNLIIDIGANEGFYSIKIKGYNPKCRVIAVEPNPYVFDILKRNIKSNNISNIILVNKAIGLKNGKISFEIVEEVSAIGAGNLRIVNRPWLKDEFVKIINVDSITFEKLCQEYNINKIDILKIDVEGMETDIIRNSKNILKRVNRIVLERHSKKLRDEIITFLTDNNFRLIFDEDPECKKYYGDLYFVNKNLN